MVHGKMSCMGMHAVVVMVMKGNQHGAFLLFCVSIVKFFFFAQLC